MYEYTHTRCTRRAIERMASSIAPNTRPTPPSTVKFRRAAPEKTLILVLGTRVSGKKCTSTPVNPARVTLVGRDHGKKRPLPTGDGNFRSRRHRTHMVELFRHPCLGKTGKRKEIFELKHRNETEQAAKMLGTSPSTCTKDEYKTVRPLKLSNGSQTKRMNTLHSSSYGAQSKPSSPSL